MVILICLTGRREDMFRIKSLTVSAVLFFHFIGCSSSLIFPLTRVTNRWILIEDGKPDYYLDTYAMRNKTKLNYLLFSLNAVTVPLDLALIPALIIGAPIYMTIAVLLFPVKI